MLAIKYIFCNDNCSDDDIAGFTYAMLAIRPSQVWLTFDFSVLIGKAPDRADFGNYDFDKDIKAYAKMFNLLRKHGIEAVHYTTGHLALISVQGKLLLERVLKEIEVTAPSNCPPELILPDFRRADASKILETASFSTSPLRIRRPGQIEENWELTEKRILISPACPQSIALMSDAEISKSRLLGFVDRDKMIQGKSIKGLTIHGYEALAELSPDVILVAPPIQHRADIVRQLALHKAHFTEIAVLA